MPTYFATSDFRRMLRRLPSADRARFETAVQKLVQGLVSGRLPNSLRVKRVQGTDLDWEMTWAPNGRAVFQYGREVKPGHPHVVWLRIGGHEILE